MSKSQAEKSKLKELGGNLRRARVAANLTQERLAELAGLNARTVQKIEAGDIAILVGTLCRLQAALGCSWRSLLGPETKA